MGSNLVRMNRGNKEKSEKNHLLEVIDQNDVLKVIISFSTPSLTAWPLLRLISPPSRLPSPPAPPHPLAPLFLLICVLVPHLILILSFSSFPHPPRFPLPSLQLLFPLLLPPLLLLLLLLLLRFAFLLLFLLHLLLFAFVVVVLLLILLVHRLRSALGGALV